MKKSNKEKLDRIIEQNVRLMKELMRELAQLEHEKQLALVRARR